MSFGKTFKIIIFILICEIAGAIGSIFTIPAISSWYNIIHKPSFTPPSWLFGPVWLILYALIGIAAGLVWYAGLKKEGIKSALIIFDIQLVLNVLWSFFFFGLRNTFYGLLDIISLWVVILATIIKFYKISKSAALLMIPYLLWTSFALLLNLYIWKLN